MKKRYDVAVIGAGPAGAMFAAELARLRPDLSILLVDGQSEDRRKVCGGLLAPDAQRVLASLGLTLPKNILADPQIFDVETIDLARGYVRHYQRHYLNMDRYAFDRWLLSHVPASVERINARCVEAKREEGAFSLTLMSGEESYSVSANALVGADGASSIVRRSFFERIPKQYVSIQQYFQWRGEELPPYSCIFDPETSDSCSWTIRKDGYLIFGGAFEPRGCREAFEKQKKRLGEFLGIPFDSAERTEACLVTSPRRYRDFETGREGVFLLGEAAGLISASSFEGISSAMISGRCLAESFADGGKSLSAVLRTYRKKIAPLRRTLWAKTFKRRILCSPILRAAIMKSGVQSIKK